MLGLTQINAVIPISSLAHTAAFQAGMLAGPVSFMRADDAFVMPGNAFRSMTGGLRVAGATGLLSVRKRTHRSPLLKFMATAALATCMGCASTGIDPKNIGYTTYPKTNIITPTGIVFEANRPLPRYESGSAFSGRLAEDIKVGEFTIKAGSEVFLDESGKIIGAIPSQDIIIPVSPIIKKIQDSFFEGIILNYELDVLKDDVRGKMTVEEVVEIVLKYGGTITIPAHGIKVYFEDDGEIDGAEFYIESLELHPQLKLFVTPLLAKKLTPFFPRS